MKKCSLCNEQLKPRRRKYCSEACRLESKRITARKWNKKNKKAHAEHQKAHKRKDPVLFKKKERAYYLRKNLENPGYFADKTMRREARKKKATPNWLSKEHLNEISEFYRFADILSKTTGIPHHVDHIEPLQGCAASGLHVPWNLQVLTAAENTSKSNLNNKKIVYFLCGQSGVGKTTLARDYIDYFHVVTYDAVNDKQLVELIESSCKPILVDISIKISTVIKKLAEVYFIRPVFIIEPVEVIEKNLMSRGKRISNVNRRYNRIVKLANKLAYYAGNTEEVRCFLDEIKETFRNRYDCGEST